MIVDIYEGTFMLMLKKFTPLIVLALFATGVYLMMQGMNNAIDMANPKKAKVAKEAK